MKYFAGAERNDELENGLYEKGHITWQIIDVRAIDKEMAITGVAHGREDARNGHATSDVTP